MFYILGILIIIFISLAGSIVIESKKLIKIRKQRDEIQLDKEHILEEYNKLQTKNENLNIIYNNLKSVNENLGIKKEDLEKEIQKIIETQKEMGLTTEQLKNTLQRSFEDFKHHIEEKKETHIDECNQEYLDVLKDWTEDFKQETLEKQEELNKLNYKLQDMKKTVDAAVAANIRAQQNKEQEKFYRLQIPEEDLEEINKLKEVGKILRNPEPLNKVIWKVYYEKPTTDLLGRVIGDKKITGIYKLTNLTNGMTYVGQCVDAASRWKQHIKRGLGAETATRNKLYPAMKEFGVENFSFEIIEECNPEELNEKEQKWQEYFSSKTFGYSIK